VRGEGDITFRELLRTIGRGGDCSGVAGLYWRRGDRFVRNPPRPESHLAGEVLPPKRAARVLDGYTLLGRPNRRR
jgi:radical SAM superfamily enzyme YgiQ (UPF0313 family)